MTVANHVRLSFALMLLIALSFPEFAQGQDAAAYFEQNCTSCHSVGGGRLLGPDLKGVTERQSRQWLERFIADPKAVLESGDAYAGKLLQEAGGIAMPKTAGMTPAMAKALVDFLEKQSKPAAAAAPGSAPAAPPPEHSAVSYFGQNCQSCHTIGGGRLGGPDLKDVTRRKDRVWLERFIQNPQSVISSGDPYAAQLLKDAQGSVMPRPPQITPTMAKALLDLIESRSAQAQSEPQEQKAEVSFTPQDVVRGERLFRGQERLAKGGPSCMSCHTVTGVGRLGGGRLGPDLTQAFRRLNGHRGLSAWLGNPPSPVMQPVFADKPLQPDEIHALTAYFGASTNLHEQSPSGSRWTFLLLGIGGAVLGLGVLDVAWKRRLRGVRRPLVHGSKNHNGGRP